MSSIEWAAWVQAVGSVAAIVAAIWISHRSDRRNRELVVEERWRQGTIVAATIAMRLGQLHRAALAQYQAINDFLRLNHDTERLQLKDARKVLGVFTVGLPGGLEGARDHALVLDTDSGVMVVTAVDAIETHNAITARAFDALDAEPCQGPAFVTLCRDRLDSLRELAKIIDTAAERLEVTYGLRQDGDDTDQAGTE